MAAATAADRVVPVIPQTDVRAAAVAVQAFLAAAVEAQQITQIDPAVAAAAVPAIPQAVIRRL
jgi:hypothetical protein